MVVIHDLLVLRLRAVAVDARVNGFSVLTTKSDLDEHTLLTFDRTLAIGCAPHLAVHLRHLTFVLNKAETTQRRLNMDYNCSCFRTLMKILIVLPL